ncbi:hypothetical protein CBR_g44395 [Chara braunii]|uniref:Reverse transcriptase domain-containing protein n=1 Tax=Chara braunii TaxID=69332 RepID=A0A388LXI7_CHABU|nr:hypothetical protein CBR_g44395 [Chara braunii]|eukprot:GBG86942.1 hypothetical protein CBR_g44395 [Chara braunii]
MERVTAVRQEGNPVSDHKPVVADIKLHLGMARGRGFFRVNNQILSVPGVNLWVSNHMSSWESTRPLFSSTAEWFDGGIAISSGVLDVISRILAKSRNKEEADCKRKVEEAEDRMGGHPISTMVWAAERERRMADWDVLQEGKQKRWSDLLKEKGIEVHDKMSKETFRKLLPSRNQQQMIALKHPFDESAPPACTAAGMLQYASLYYKDILTTRRPLNNVNSDLSRESNMWEDTTARLGTSAKLDLDRPLTLEELTQTLKSMAKGKSPGVDGLTVEFYVANWRVFGPLLVELYNEILVGGRLGRGMTHGVIVVLFKKGDKAEVRNCRPISLLNVSYKILAKSLARRLSKFLPDLVEKDQGAFVQGRSIFNNIVMAVETLEVVQKENLDVAVLLLDLEKAYDKVGLTTLRRMGFGENFCAWIIAMYTHASSAVMINGHLSEPFPLTRSLRQGCPLAPLVFVLQMEVLLNKIRQHSDIRGLQLHNGEDCRVKALADDLFAVSKNTAGSPTALKTKMEGGTGPGIPSSAGRYIPPSRRTPGQQQEGMGRGAASNAARSSAPPIQSRSQQGAEDRVQESVSRCYDEGICPNELGLGEVVEDEEGGRFVVDETVDIIKENWLKEITVILIFQEEARNLSRQVKEDLIRAYEDGWMSQQIFDPDTRRGRIRFEGQNVVSYVAKAKEVADWMLRSKEAKLKLGNKEYLTIFKPWMPRQELRDMKLQDAEKNLWIVALRVQLDAYYYLGEAVGGMFGEVLEMHPPEYDRTRPKLMNVKMDMHPYARFNVDDVLVIESPKGPPVNHHQHELQIQAYNTFPDYPKPRYPSSSYDWRELAQHQVQQGTGMLEQAGQNAMGETGCSLGGDRQHGLMRQRRRNGKTWRTWVEEETRRQDVITRSEADRLRNQDRVAKRWGDECDGGHGRDDPPSAAPVIDIQVELSKTSISSQSRVRMESEKEEESLSRELSSSSMESSAHSRLQQREERGATLRQQLDRNKRSNLIHKDQAETVRRRIVLLVCMQARDGTYFLALWSADGRPYIPSEKVERAPTHSVILQKTRSLYKEHSPIRVYPSLQ